MKISTSSIVRTSLASLVALVATAAFTAPASAQTGRETLRVNIPFAFQNGSTHLNPGVYTLAPQSENVLAIRDRRGATVTLMLATSSETPRPSNVSKVVFHKYGDRYFLREVWVEGSSNHLDCVKSKAESRLQKERQIALATGRPDGTEVALLELPR